MPKQRFYFEKVATIKLFFGEQLSGFILVKTTS